MYLYKISFTLFYFMQFYLYLVIFLCSWTANTHHILIYINYISFILPSVKLYAMPATKMYHATQIDFYFSPSSTNGINLRNATEQQARLIIGQQCDTITIMAQYNPHMYQLGNHSRSRYSPFSISFSSG